MSATTNFVCPKCGAKMAAPSLTLLQELERSQDKLFFQNAYLTVVKVGEPVQMIYCEKREQKAIMIRHHHLLLREALMDEHSTTEGPQDL